MKEIQIGKSDVFASQIALGCMRISKLTVYQVENLILSAVKLGINFFDHADIYGGGKSEELFGEVLKRNPGLREKIIIQSKCGIRKGYYDMSKEHIINSVNNSLKRLGVNYLDILLLHRPDALMDINEVNEAFNILKAENKVKHFGVSNMNPMQIELLKKGLDVDININQLQYSIVHSGMNDIGFNVNMKNNLAVSYDNSVLDYCQLNDITVQPWSVLQASWEDGSFLNNPKYPELNELLNNLARKYEVTPSAIAIAWILRLPQKMQPIVGTTNPVHLQEIVQADNIELTRQEWYEIYTSTGKIMP